jgi:hypothetical protein
MENKSCFLCIFSILLFPVSSFTQIKVLESTPLMVRLAWEIEKIDTAILGSGDQQSVMLSFKGQNTVVVSAGDVTLPGYSLFTGIPPIGEIEVSVIAEQVSSMLLTASPFIQQNGKSIVQQSSKFVSPWISQPVYEYIRGIRTAAMIVRPAVYDNNSRILRIMTRGIITIKFPPGMQQSYIAERSEFETMLSQLLCNYPVAVGWRTVPGGLKKRKNDQTFPLDTNKKVYHFRVGDGNADFNEVTILENGLLKIPGSAVINVFGMTPIANVKLYASVKGELPVYVSDIEKLPDGIVEIPLLRIDRNKDGMVDVDDFFITYVTGASDWIFDNGNYKFNTDRYDDYRNYWLTTGNNGSSIVTFTGNLHADTVIHHFVQPCYFKESHDIPKESEGGLKRIWKRLTRSNLKFIQPLSLTGIDTMLPGNLRIGFELTYTGALRLQFGDVDEDSIFDNLQYPVSSWSNRKVDCEFVPLTDTSFCEIHDVVVNYYRKMDVPDRGMLTIFSMPEAINYAYTISGLDGHLVYIVRLSADDRIELVDTVRNSSDGTFSWVDSGLTGARYIVCREDNLLPFPSHVEYRKSFNVKHSIHNLRNVSNRTDYLIITDSTFAAQAETLAVHKIKMGFTNPAIIDIGDIYRLFSGGDVDPSAIRNFIQYVKKCWINGFNLDYVLLMGTGNYDYKSKFKNIPVRIPVYYDPGDRLFDDYFSVTDPNTLFPSCAIGRITCVSAREADAVVRKVREYEDPDLADFGAWRNRALFVADDDKQGDREDPVSQSDPHHISSDQASDSLTSKWKSLDLRKVFLFEYEWDSSRRKPGATRAIINQINNGVGIVNYFGHGSYYLWSDEQALNISDLGKLYNRNHYPVVLSFSCSVGKFDQPGAECLSGALVKLENAGAIASISSSRESYASGNTSLAFNFFNQLIDSCSRMQSIGIMLVKGKILVNNSENSRKYVLMGDPSIRIVQSVRNVPLDLVNSNDSSLSEIKSMQLIKVKGKVLGSDGTIDKEYGNGTRNAYVQIGLFNPDEISSRKDGDTPSVHYVLPGSPVFLGKTNVNKGEFEQAILIPRNIVFNKKGVKLTAFSWCDGKNDCGSGFKTGFVFNGSADGNTKDSTGPAISIQNFETKHEQASTSSGVVLSLQLALYDPSGIDIIGTGPDEGLTLEISGLVAKRNISNNFQFKEGDFKSGTVQLELPLSLVRDESYALVISSRDLLGNLSVITFPIDLKKNAISDIQQDPDLDHTFNFPNPVRLGKTTRFFFFRSEANQQIIPYHYRFTVKIYTLNGKLVRVFKDAKHGEIWDCSDQGGKLLSPDTYLYQVQAYSYLKKKTIKGKIEKIVIHPPR